MHGKKIQGEFALIKMPHTKEDDAWLLIKKGDEYASTTDITKQDESIKTHRKVDDLGAHGKLPDLSDFPKVSKPWTVTPMLCTLVDEPFSNENWLFEIKWDGYRAVATKHKDKIELYSRNHNSFMERYTPIAEAIRGLNHDIIFDGEIVVVDREGHAHFEWLQNWHQAPHGVLQYHIFDILWIDGRDVRTMPLRSRKALLKAILPKIQRFNIATISKPKALSFSVKCNGGAWRVWWPNAPIALIAKMSGDGIGSKLRLICARKLSLAATQNLAGAASTWARY